MRPTRINHPTLEKVTTSIKGMKNNKATGEDGIAVEMLKAETFVQQKIHKLVTKVWETEETPHEWKEAIIVPSTRKAANKIVIIRPISLLNETYKVLSNITQRRLEEQNTQYH